MNYGESLAYWYLRLNGFFPITNFVMHKFEDFDYRGDCDILAVRFPYVFEKIGGKKSDWDSKLFEKLEYRHEQPLCIGLIVQVKTGYAGPSELNNFFTEKKIEYALKRIGFMSTDNIINLVQQFHNRATIKEDGFLLAKLAILKDVPDNQSTRPYVSITLKDTNRFILGRFMKYSEKNRDRIYFSDPLIQYLADSHLQNSDQRPVGRED